MLNKWGKLICFAISLPLEEGIYVQYINYLLRCGFKLLEQFSFDCWLYCSWKYPYPSHRGFFWFQPPPLWKFQFCFILSFKNFGFWALPPPPWNFNDPWRGGHGYFLELHIIYLRDGKPSELFIVMHVHGSNLNAKDISNLPLKPHFYSILLVMQGCWPILVKKLSLKVSK